jgi:pyridoxine kinase
MQLLGYEVDPLNTVEFSNHTRYSCFTGTSVKESIIADLFRGLIKNDFANEYSHILTGYVGKEDSLETIANNVQILKQLNGNIKVLVDPVLGDNGNLYCPPELVPIYKIKLFPLADIITPNGFEAEL